MYSPRTERLEEFGVTLLHDFVIKLRIAAIQKTQNGSGKQVLTDLQPKNSAINENLFGKSKQ